MLTTQKMLKLAFRKSSVISRRHLIEQWRTLGIEAAKIAWVTGQLKASKLM